VAAFQLDLVGWHDGYSFHRGRCCNSLVL
jgi:hypothetical protein